MPTIQRRKILIVTIIVLAVVLVVVVVSLLLGQARKPANITAPVSSKQTPPSKEVKNPTESDTPVDTTQPVVDPATLASVAIEPLAITVFYLKGTPGFEFTVLKTADKTQYVQFTSPDLIGTKCTNDQGDFASIIKNPSSSETQTTTQTVKVGSDTYGLSLASPGCTGNTELLTKYQTGFKNGFSNLKTL